MIQRSAIGSGLRSPTRTPSHTANRPCRYASTRAPLQSMAHCILADRSRKSAPERVQHGNRRPTACCDSAIIRCKSACISGIAFLIRVRPFLPVRGKNVTKVPPHTTRTQNAPKDRRGHPRRRPPQPISPPRRTHPPDQTSRPPPVPPPQARNLPPAVSHPDPRTTPSNTPAPRFPPPALG